jgi:hypothetical protein
MLKTVSSFLNSLFSFDGSTLVFNENGQNIDLRVEGDTDPNLLFTDASVDRVGFGTSLPLEKLHVNGNSTVGTISGTRPSRHTVFDVIQKASIAAGGTAVIDIVANNADGNFFSAAIAEIDLLVALASSPASLQAHYKYAYATVTNSTTGGTATITEMFNGSAGNFVVAAGDFAVTRPSARTIRITYTNNSTVANRIAVGIKGWSIASVSIV